MSDPSQQASGSANIPPPATPMTVEAMGHALQSLMQAMNVMVTTINNLTTNVNIASSVHPRATKVAVSKPKAWNGKGGSMEARHFLAAFYNYAQNEGETLNDWDAATLSWDQNDDKWIATILNLMEDEARTWALPYLETLALGRHPFSGLYRNFMDAFTKRFAPLDSTEAMRDALKALKQGKSSVAEYISKFDQFTQQTGWSDTDHRTRFYDGLTEGVKDALTFTNRPTTSLNELKTAAHIFDQCIRQCNAEKGGKPTQQLHLSPGSGKDPNAMDVDASRQSDGKEVRNRKTYTSFMRGKCFGCGSPDHTKKEGGHKRDICNHCKKVGHRSPLCMAKYLGKKVVAKAAASSETPEDNKPPPPAAKAATTMSKGKALAPDVKAQADLMAKLMAQVEEQSKELAALKASF